MTQMAGFGSGLFGFTNPSRVFTNQIVLFKGGQFIYNGTPKAGNHPIASFCPPGVTKDPYGNTVIADAIATYNAFGACINLLSMAKSAFFQYQDSGSATQGALILSVSSTSGNDPINNTFYPAGLFGINPVFANSMTAVGSQIQLNLLPYSAPAEVQAGGNATQGYMEVDSPVVSSQARLIMRLFGDNNVATALAQMNLWRDTGDGNVHPLNALAVCGPVVALNPATPVPGTLETWHQLALVTGWTGTFNYRLTPRNTVLCDYNITFTDNGTTHLANNTGVGILPAAYSPIAGTTKKTTPQLAGSGNVLAANRTPDMQVGSNGSIFVFNVTTSALNNTAIFTGTWEFPLDI